jgi:hypothetical protein
MKKSKIKQIPMFPTSYWDIKTKQRIELDVLSHSEYSGEFRSGERDPVTGICAKIGPVMVDNVPWDDELIYDGYYRGRSAAGATFTNAKGQRFTVFMTDLDTFIPLMVKGKITGKFIYCKRGMNYGVTLYTP